jgi:hypothetical protein
MPRYFFHVEDGDPADDAEGAVLEDLAEARVQAVRLAGGMLSDGVDDTLWQGKPWRLAVEDEAGRTVIVLKFVAETVAEPESR